MVRIWCSQCFGQGSFPSQESHSSWASLMAQRVKNVGDMGLIPGLGRFPGGGCDNPLHYSSLENPHLQRSLAGFSPQGCKELDMTERLRNKAI